MSEIENTADTADAVTFDEQDDAAGTDAAEANDSTDAAESVSDEQ